MDAYLVTLAAEAGTAVVTLLVHEGWQQARDGVVTVWRRYRPHSADDVERELDSSRRALLTAADSGDATAEEHEAQVWQQRLTDLLAEHPQAAEELRALVAGSEPEPIGQDIKGDVRFNGRATGHGRVFQSMGAQHIHER